MKKVGIREFRKKMAEYLENLPITLTKYDDDFATIVGVDKAPKRRVVSKGTSKVCKHGNIPDLCKQCISGK